MPDINGIPYVESDDLVSAYPSVSQSLAQEVSDQLASKGDYTDWTTYTPTVDATTGTITTGTVQAARYAQVGKVVHLYIRYSITTAGTAAGALRFTLPVAATAAFAAVGSIIDFGLTLLSGAAYLQTTTRIDAYKYDGTTLIGSNREYVLTLTYEAA